jgi:hypothetical protein
MFKLELGKSYAWALAIFMTVFGGVISLEYIFRQPTRGAPLIMPAFFALVLLCEVRSGIALDPAFRASYVRGTPEYRKLLIWQVYCLLFLVGVSIFILF